MKITFELSDDPETGEEDKAKRLMVCDEAFMLLWDIDQKLRGYLKYGTDKKADDIMEEIRSDINDSNLLELYS